MSKRANKPLAASERFSKKKALEAVENINQVMPIQNLDLLRIGMNAVFADELTVVRIHSPALDKDFVQNQIDFANFLIEKGVLTPKPLKKEPVLHNGYLVSFWQKINNLKDLDPVEAGSALKLFHQATADLPQGNRNYFDYFKKMEYRLKALKDSGLVSANDINYFENFLAREYQRWQETKRTLNDQVIHSDVNASNMLKNDQGVYIFDFDWVSFGPLEADLFKISLSRYGQGQDFENDFFQGYGLDPVDYPRISILYNLQLFSQTALLAVLEQTPEVKKEFKIRMKYWQNQEDPSSPAWREL